MQPKEKELEPLSYSEAMDVIGGFSRTSKMPWLSWSTSAFDCKTGTKLREVKGSTCESCYACKGCYVFNVVKNAHQRNIKALDNPRFEEAFVQVITTLHSRVRNTYTKNGIKIKENRFRWHDSGDLQSVEHLEMIVRIALKTPEIDYWLPTREYGMVKEYLKKHDGFPANLTVRMSATMVGQDFPKRPMDLPYSTVGVNSDKVVECNAASQDNKCLDCRACWDKDEDINYPLH